MQTTLKAFLNRFGCFRHLLCDSLFHMLSLLLLLLLPSPLLAFFRTYREREWERTNSARLIPSLEARVPSASLPADILSYIHILYLLLHKESCCLCHSWQSHHRSNSFSVSSFVKYFRYRMYLSQYDCLGWAYIRFRAAS